MAKESSPPNCSKPSLTILPMSTGGPSFLIKMITLWDIQKCFLPCVLTDIMRNRHFLNRWNSLRHKKTPMERNMNFLWNEQISEIHLNNTIFRSFQHFNEVILNVSVCISCRNHSDLHYTILIAISSSGLSNISQNNNL